LSNHYLGILQELFEIGHSLHQKLAHLAVFGVFLVHILLDLTEVLHDGGLGYAGDDLGGQQLVEERTLDFK
jgi:hypothetical protein